MALPHDIFFPAIAAGEGSVSLTWLGTAGFALEHHGHVIVIDPYLTRASLSRCFWAPLQSDAQLTEQYVPRADAIVLSHTHFDHALDAPEIARRTGARVFGSRSALNLCRSFGVPETQIEAIEPAAGSTPHEAEVGPFRLRFWPSAHSAFLLGRIPFPGDIADCCDVPLRTQGYRCGMVIGTEIEVAGRRIFHVGSAELVERHWQINPVDLALACVAGWTSTERYPERLVAALSPGTVLFHHWDNFLRDLAQGAVTLPAMRFPALIDRLQTAAPSLKIGALPMLGTYTL
ncbi:MAG TPA: MBL fold metallo-hydrolase [Terriglobales bacterium]|nr:MBL fold metallo-hydrolase [Terriglobales bacterium]